MRWDCAKVEGLRLAGIGKEGDKTGQLCQDNCGYVRILTAREPVETELAEARDLSLHLFEWQWLGQGAPPCAWWGAPADAVFSKKLCVFPLSAE